MQTNLRPTHNEKNLGAMKGERAVKRITFGCREAGPSDTLYVSVPKMNKNEVLVPGSLALLLNIDLAGGHAKNFLVQNVTRALVVKLVVKRATHCRKRWIIQDLGGPFPLTGGAGQQAAHGHSEQGPLQDPLRRGGQENLGCRGGKQAEQGLRNKIPNQTGPPDPDRPWRLLSPSSLQRPHV